MSSAVACSSALVRDDAEMMRCVIRLRVGRDSYIDKHNALYCWWWTRPQRPATRIPGEHAQAASRLQSAGRQGGPCCLRRARPGRGRASYVPPRPLSRGHMSHAVSLLFFTFHLLKKQKGFLNEHAPGRRPGDTHLTGAATLGSSLQRSGLQCCPHSHPPRTPPPARPRHARSLLRAG